jgi:hypothetical protein
MYLKCGDIGQECELFRCVFHLNSYRNHRFFLLSRAVI